MKTYLLILPVSFLVVYSQLVVKWRASSTSYPPDAGLLRILFAYLGDPLIISAYMAALFASFAWLYVVTKLTLSIAFPIYIGITFIMVVLGSWIFLAESMTQIKLLAIVLIFTGVVLGVVSDG